MEIVEDIFHIIAEYLNQVDVVRLSQTNRLHYDYCNISKYGKFGDIRIPISTVEAAKRLNKYGKAPIRLNNINKIHLVLSMCSLNPCRTLIITNSTIVWEKHISLFDVDVDIKLLSNKLDISAYDRVILDDAERVNHRYTKLFHQLIHKSVIALYNNISGGIGLFRKVFSGRLYIPIYCNLSTRKLHHINYDQIILDTIGRTEYDMLVALRYNGSTVDMSDLCGRYPLLGSCLKDGYICRDLLYKILLPYIHTTKQPHVIINDSIVKNTIDDLELGKVTEVYTDKMTLTTCGNIYIVSTHKHNIEQYLLARHTNIYILYTTLVTIQ